MANSSLPVEADRRAVSSDERITYLSLHAVNIFVRDQDRSLRFYLDQLGFNLAFDARLQSGSRWVAVSPPDGSAVLSLVAPRRESREYKLIGRATQVVFVTEDVIAQFHQWRARGVQFSHTPRLRRVRYERAQGEAAEGEAPVWGGVFTRFRDIDGNTFSLIGLDAVTREIERRRRAHAERLEMERRAARELEIAKQVQARLFPQNLPALRTLEYSGACIQARQVGGDYYDFLSLSQERLGLVIGDTSGKGMPAALLMANLQANFRSQCATAAESPAQFLRSVNELFYENTTDSAYATLFFAEYDDRLRRLRYANCGHLAALLVRADGAVERLESTGTVLGLFREWDCSLAECSLSCGDLLALYTDGVTECFNEGGEEFGEQRLIEALGRNRFLPAKAAVASIVEEVKQFSASEQYDDITLVVARCTGE
jgi:serine phosphatase RsbU (regulator of sigma subunit)/catechol 2,3-dioxygenase-like lactoylglutathione lyase family enzyme